MVKISNLGVQQHVVWACTLGQVAEWKEMSGDSGFPCPGDIADRQRWAKEWSTASVDRKTAPHDLYEVSKRLVDVMHRKYGEANDSLKNEQAEDRLIRVELTVILVGRRFKRTLMSKADWRAQKK